MSKIEVVRKAMQDALKAGDKPRKDALSLLLSALKAKWIDKRADLTEEEENAIVYKELKEAQETLDTTPADRTDIIEETRLRMFEQFYQGEVSHAREGNGLGLSIVKRIVELHGGKVDVESARDRGTLVSVWLPLNKEYDQTDRSVKNFLMRT